MSENKYTPEPWCAFNNGEGVVGVGTDVSDVCWTRIEEGGWLNSDRTIDTDYENARRIVACVNRLAQFTTEQIEDFGYDLFAEDRPRLVEAQNEIHLLKKQRDELLAAIEKMLDALVISVPMAFAAAIQNMDIEDDDAEEIHAIGAALAEEIPDDGRTVRETLRFLTTALSIAQSTIARAKGEQ